MRKIWDSSNTSPTASLMAHADARSWPIGFSRTTRDDCVDQVVGGQMRGDRTEQAGRAGQVEHPDLAGIGRQQRRQRGASRLASAKSMLA